MKIVLTLKSGAQVRVDVDKFDVVTSRTTGEITALRWDTPARFEAKLIDVNFAEIACIHREN